MRHTLYVRYSSRFTLQTMCITNDHQGTDEVFVLPAARLLRQRTFNACTEITHDRCDFFAFRFVVFSSNFVRVRKCGRFRYRSIRTQFWNDRKNKHKHQHSNIAFQLPNLSVETCTSMSVYACV